jgi:hypothetical protein
VDSRLGYVLDLNINVISHILFNIFFFHFQIDFMLHIDEKNMCKDSKFGNKFHIYIHVHNIDICYFLKVIFFHHKRYLS